MAFEISSSETHISIGVKRMIWGLPQPIFISFVVQALASIAIGLYSAFVLGSLPLGWHQPILTFVLMGLVITCCELYRRFWKRRAQVGALSEMLTNIVTGKVELQVEEILGGKGALVTPKKDKDSDEKPDHTKWKQ